MLEGRSVGGAKRRVHTQEMSSQGSEHVRTQAQSAAAAAVGSQRPHTSESGSSLGYGYARSSEALNSRSPGLSGHSNTGRSTSGREDLGSREIRAMREKMTSSFRPPSPYGKESTKARTFLNSENWHYYPMSDLLHVEYVGRPTRMRQIEALRMAIAVGDSGNRVKDGGEESVEEGEEPTTTATISVTPCKCSRHGLRTYSSSSLRPSSARSAAESNVSPEKNGSAESSPKSRQSTGKDTQRANSASQCSGNEKECQIETVFGERLEIPERLRHVFKELVCVPSDTFEAPPSFIGRYGNPKGDEDKISYLDLCTEYFRWFNVIDTITKREKKADQEKERKRLQELREETLKKESHKPMDLTKMSNLEFLSRPNKVQTSTSANPAKIRKLESNSAASSPMKPNTIVKKEPPAKVTQFFENPWIEMRESMKKEFEELPPPFNLDIAPLKRSSPQRDARRGN